VEVIRRFKFVIACQIALSCVFILMVNSLAADRIHAVQESPTQVTPEQIEGLKDNQDAIKTTTLYTAGTTILLLLLNMIREERKSKRDDAKAEKQRANDLEDRRLAREEQAQRVADLREEARIAAETAKSTAEQVAHELKLQAIRAKLELQQSEQRIVDKIDTKVDENTRVNVEALNARIEIETRIAELTRMFMASTVDAAHSDAKALLAEERADRAEGKPDASPRPQ
jgi:molybdenum cofactor biosynthesis enzyme